jgi:hypothetical protein
MDRAKVPAEARAYRTKPDIALAEIDRVRSAGVRFGGILADAGYGLSGPLRQALTERGLTWAVGIPYKQKVYPAYVAMIFPAKRYGWPASTAPLANANTTSAICPPTHRSRSWPVPSRPAGSASKLINS